MTKNEYLESKRGLPYTQIIAEQPTEPTIGSITAADVEEMTTVLADGLRYEVDTYQVPADDDTNQIAKLYSAIRVALSNQHVYSPSFKINFSIPKIWGMYQSALYLGMIGPNSANGLEELYMYDKAKYGITREDCAAYFGTGEWQEFIVPDSVSTLLLRTHSALPESSYIMVEMQELDEGQWSTWFHATAVHGIKEAKSYKFTIPAYAGHTRKIRWKGAEYLVDSSISGA